MDEIKVELVKSAVTDLRISLNFEDASVSQLNTNQSAAVYEPTDENDPTVLIKAECTMKDPTEKLLVIECKADFIIKFDPLPDNRSKAASELCAPIIHAAFARIASALLRDMGHDLAIN